MNARIRQRLWLAEGAVREVGPVLDEFDAQDVFLVRGRGSFATSGAQEALNHALGGRRVTSFADFAPNPGLGDVERGLDRYRQSKATAILAVGGGSTLDMAKMISLFSAQTLPPAMLLDGPERLVAGGPPVIAVPTTAGSGSESTHFAVVYRGTRKYSVAHACMLPDHAIVDPELTSSAPPRLSATTGLDALAQAVESLWSVRSTEASRALAREAIPLALAHLERTVLAPNRHHRAAMSRAANLAGRAIDISLTTAPHALSYAMTAHFGVPHGHAVALTLGAVLVHNSGAGDADTIDPRGPAHVRAAVDDINRAFGCATAPETAAKLEQLLVRLSLPTRLGLLGAAGRDDRALLVDEVNPERLGNNPRRLERKHLQEVIAGIA